MKKYLYLLGFLLIPQIIFAQGTLIVRQPVFVSFAVYEDIVIPKSGGNFQMGFTVRDNWMTENANATSLMYELRQELQEYEITWLDISSLYLQPYETQGTIIYTVSATTSDRTLILQSASNSVTIKQFSNDPRVYAISNSGSHSRLPEDEKPVHLSGSEIGRTYDLYRSNVIVDSKPGTDGPITFYAPDTGAYTIKTGTTAMSGTVYYSLYGFLGSPAVYPSTNPTLINKNGGTFFVECGSHDDPPTVSLREYLPRLNSGEFSTWNNKIKITLDQWDDFWLKFRIDAEPNFGTSDIINTTHIKTTATETWTFSQPGNADIYTYNVTGLQANDDIFHIIVSSSQKGLVYKLYKDGIHTQSLNGTGGQLLFGSLNKSGVYTVFATYENRSVKMNGEYEITLMSDTNSLRTITYTGNPITPKIEDISFYDGLGYLIQETAVCASPDKNDIITPQYYDNMRRDSRTYLPYMSKVKTGMFRDDAITAQADFYRSKFNDEKPYIEKEYEASPLSRVKAQVNVGQAFHTAQKKTLFDYQANTSADGVIRFALDDITHKLEISLYTKAQLFKTTTTNEDDALSIQFKNTFDQTILERAVDENNVNYDTYYVYDDFGQLAWVLPPKAIAELNAAGITSISLSDDIALHYCYIYKYDTRNRCIGKKLPGKEWEWMIYDKADRLVMSQDGNLREEDRWLYNVYDNLNRLVSTSLVEQQKTSLTRQDIQDRYNAPGFDNSYPTLGGSPDRYCPFADSAFALIALLSESKYGGSQDIDTTPRVIISEIFYDTPLNEQIATGQPYSNGEFLELYNCGAVAVDMSDWVLTGGGVTEVFPFPAGTTIQPGGHIIVAYQYNNSGFVLEDLFDGFAETGPNRQVFYQRKIILANSGEQLTLKDADGVVRDAIYYDGTSNKTKPNRLTATNEDDTPGWQCLSIQRVVAAFDPATGCAIADNTHWATALVTPCAQLPQFAVNSSSVTPSTIPAYLSPETVAGIMDVDEHIDSRTIGLKTYDKIAVVTDNIFASPSFVERAYYYDYKGRIVQTVEKNHLGGISRTSFNYDFLGNVLAKSESHQPPAQASPDVLTTYYTYDHRGRLLSDRTTLNSGEPVTVNYTYDELGQLSAKSYGSAPETGPEYITMDQIPVGRNIRGWKFKLTRTDLTPDLPVGTFYKLHLNNTPFMNFEHYEDANVIVRCNSYVKVTEEDVWDFYNGRWKVGEEYIFTIKDDQDYFVTTNDLFAGNATTWGFDCMTALVPEAEGIKETYSYNIQGWQTDHNVTQNRDLLYRSQLRYFNPRHNYHPPLYSGNIAEWEWQHSDADLNTYSYKYDNLSRLNYGIQFVNNIRKDDHEEKGITYDANGNILSLYRTYPDRAEISDYSYSGNQLTKLDVSIRGVVQNYTYDYDANGNMTRDGANDLDITYNHLNLIQKVELPDGDVVNYSYLSDGTKLSAEYVGDDQLVYLGSLVYLNGNEKYILLDAPFSAGRFLDYGIGTPLALYYIQDHLGSVRAVIEGQTGEVVEQNDYYPFGLRWDNQNATISGFNRYRYNGKEDQEIFGIPYIDYGFRMYDPKYRLSWNNGDRLMEKYNATGQHVFCLNNPIRFFDPDGTSPYYDINGTFIRVDQGGFSGLIYIVDSNNNIKPINKEPSLSLEAQSNIYTHVLNQMPDIDFSNLYNDKVSIFTGKAINGVRQTYNDADSYVRYGFSRTDEGKFKISVKEGAYKNDLKNVEVIQNYLGVHEYEGHGTKKRSGGENPGGTHYKAYEDQKKHPTFKKMPSDLKNEVERRIKELMKIENPRLYQQRYGNH